MRADRLLSIILLLQIRGKMTAKSLAEELEVSRRTILRDITALSFSGVPVYSEGGHGGGIALAEEYRTTLTGLNKFEVQSLFVANNNDALRDACLCAPAFEPGNGPTENLQAKGSSGDNRLSGCGFSARGYHDLAVVRVMGKLYVCPADDLDCLNNAVGVLL